MKSAYIAGPLSTYGSKEENLQSAFSAAAKYIKLGYRVFCPHHFEIIRKSTEEINQPLLLNHTDWMVHCIYWLRKCDIVVFLPNWEKSTGCKIEMMCAEAMEKEIRYEKGAVEYDN